MKELSTPRLSPVKEAVPPAPQPARAVLHQPGLVPFIGCYGADLFADSLWFLTIGWAAAHLGGAAQTSVVLAVGSIPRALLMLFGGVVADRSGPQRTALFTLFARVVVMACFALLTLTGHLSVLLLIAAAAAFGIIDGVHMPALASIPAVLVTGQDLVAVQALLQTLARVVGVAGTAAAGLVIARYGLSQVSLLAAIALVIAWPLLVRATRQAHPSTTTPHVDSTTKEHLRDGHRVGRVLTEIRAGLTLTFTHPTLGWVLTLVTVLNLFGTAPLFVGIPVQAARLDWTATSFGYISAAFGVGATLSSLTLLLARRPRHPVRAGLLWCCISAVAISALAYANTPMQAAAAVTLAGLGIGPAGALLIGHVQSQAPKTHLARVMSLAELSSVGLVPVGYLLYGVAAQQLGQSATTFFCGLIKLAVALTGLSLSRLRHA